MRKMLLAFVVLLVMGALAVAQTPTPTVMPDQGQTAPMASVEQTDLNSPNFTHQDFAGTQLEKAYQQEEKSGWENPNLTKSAGIDGPSGQ